MSVERNGRKEVRKEMAISFSKGSSWSRDQTLVSYIAGELFTIWAAREALGRKPLKMKVYI